MSQLVPVKLSGRLQVRNGGLLHPGEVAWLPADEARALIAQGGGLAYEPPQPVPAVRAPSAPPADKMLRPGGTKRK